MAFKVQKAVREKIYTKVALMAPSGGGKTYSALRLATGMKEELEKITGKPCRILMANTEGARGRYYANEFDYDIIDLVEPFNPEQFSEAIDFAVNEGYDILLMDSTSPEWDAHIENVKGRFKAGRIKMADISPYLYLYDLVTGRRTDYEMRYAFIDEIQDYTPFQLAYLKYNFPRAKFTMLGDLNQAIFTKDESKTLLSQISKLFDPEKTDVVQLTKSYRSTKEITNFTKQILRQGEKIEAFDRRGPKPAFYKRDSIEKEYSALEDILAENDEQKLTTAIITKTLAEAQEVAKVLKERNIKATLIGSANQRLVPGTLVMPSYLAKGLEFDAVVAWGVSKENYHQLDETQLLYTIASRAMYKLDLIYTGEKSPLFDNLDEKTYVNK